MGRGLLLILCVAATSSCGGCEVNSGPIPGGFPAADRISRAAQIRLTERGLDSLAVAAEGWIGSAAQIDCTSSAECPPASACVTGRCDADGVALDLLGGRLFLQMGTLSLDTLPPDGLRTTITVDVFGDGLDVAGCPAQIDSPGTDMRVDLTLAPSIEGRISFEVTSVQLPLMPSSVSTSCDPASVTAQVRSAVEPALLPLLSQVVGTGIGQGCDLSADCPAGADCVSGTCVEAGTQRILPPGLDVDERISIPPVLEAYGTPDAVSDLSMRIGGAVDVDNEGVTTGVEATMELASPYPRCANIQTSPRLRPGFVAPAALPGTGDADLDFDGTPETPYQLAFGLSQALVDQAAWSVYGGGLLCGALSTADFDDLHTGTLEIIIPSVRFLTRSHLYPRSERPARISLWMLQEPEIQIGSGQITDDGVGNITFDDPIVHAYLRDVEINLSALVEDRWVRILTATLDLHLGIGLMITPDGELEPIVGVGVQDIISNVRISNSGLLVESPASLEQALPTLISFALLEFAGSAGTFPIPSLPGTTLDILGVRGLPSANGGFDTLAVYADFGFETNNLTAAAETEARVQAVNVPATADFAVDNGATWPSVDLAVGGFGEPLEYQVRVDGGFWSPFFAGPELTVRRPELLVQGQHQIEVRARTRGAYTSLDPTPVSLSVWIDSEPPSVKVEGDQVVVYDRVSKDAVKVTADGTPLPLVEGRAQLPADTYRLVATDQAGLTTTLQLKTVEATPPVPVATGCSATSTGSDASAPKWVLLFGLLLFRKPVGRRRRSPRRSPYRS